MKKYDFTVFGCATSVCVLKTESLPVVGKTIWIKNANVEPFNGGIGFNISANLTGLGAKVFPVLSYSDDRMERLLNDVYAKEKGWPTSGFLGPKGENYRMCYMLQDSDLNHMTIMYRYGKDACENSQDQVIDIKEEYFADSKMVILASPRPVNTYPIYRYLVDHKIPYVFSYRNDPTIFPEAVLKQIIIHASMMFMNEFEAQDVCRRFGLADIEDILNSTSIHTLCITVGKDGSTVYHKENGQITKYKVEATCTPIGNIDSVGAGDAYLSGFMYGYINGKSLPLCGQYGSTMASFAIEKEGSTTNIPTIEQLLERNSTRPDALYE